MQDNWVFSFYQLSEQLKSHLSNNFSNLVMSANPMWEGGLENVDLRLIVLFSTILAYCMNLYVCQ